MPIKLDEALARLVARPERRPPYYGEATDEVLVDTFLAELDDRYATSGAIRAVAVEAFCRWVQGLLAVQEKGRARAIEMTRVLAQNGHIFPLRRMQTEPDEAANCLRCGVSYAGTGPTMSDPCSKGALATPRAFQTLEEFGRENFSPEFLAQARDEYRHAEIAAEDHDLCWFDGILPRWEFYRRTGGGFYVGIDEETGDSVEGATEEAVYQAALDLDMQRVEEMFEGDDAEECSD